MACYLGETLTTSDTVAFTHAFDTPWDAQSGQSVLMELCRMLQNRRTALNQSTLSFPVVGANPSDTAPASINYEANSAINPPRHFHQILTYCHTQLLAILHPDGVINSSGYRWWFTGATTIRDTLIAALTGLDFQKQQDWQPIIEAMRTALVSLSGAQIQSAAWTPVSYQFVLTSLITGDPAENSNVVTKWGGIDPDTVRDDEVLAGTGHGTTVYVADVVSPANDWPQSFDYEHSGTAPSISDGHFVGFHVDDGAALPNSGINNHGVPDGSTTDIVVKCNHVQSGGWFFLPKSKTKSWRVRGRTMANNPLTGGAITAMIGKSANWSISLTGTVSPSPSPLVLDPASGSVTFTTSSQVTNGRLVQSNMTMPDDTIPDDAPALAWADQAFVDYGGTPAGVTVGGTQLALTNNVHSFCIDANGVHHDD